MTVTNNGTVGLTATAVNLNAMPLIKAGTASIALPMSNAAPTNVALAAGASQDFTYTIAPTPRPSAHIRRCSGRTAPPCAAAARGLPGDPDR
jgi:hypothetical protein